MYHTLLNEQIIKHLPAALASDHRLQDLLRQIDGLLRDYDARIDRKDDAIEECANSLASLTGQTEGRTNLFRILLSKMHSGVAIEDEDRRVVFANQRFCDLMALPYRPEELIGADASLYAERRKDYFMEPDAAQQAMEDAYAAREPVNDRQLEMANGTVLSWSYLPIRAEGNDKGHFWEFRDVTASVRAAQQLKESEERNRLVLSASLDAIIIADSDRAICYWNPRAEAIFGWTPEEALGKRMNELLHPRRVSDLLDQQEIEYPDDDLSPVLNHTLELTAVNKAGKEFTVELIVVPFQQHGKTFYCKFVKDISHRRENEERLQRQEVKYHHIIANMKLGMVEVALDNTLHTPNQAFLDMLGYTQEEIVGKTFYKLMPSEAVRASIDERLERRRGGASDNYEVPIVNKSGELRWWLVSGAPSYNEQGETEGSVAIVLDITEQKRLATELVDAKLNAEQASLAKEAFLANMSHEIRTPLNAIIGMIRELKREQLSHEQRSYLGHTDTAAHHLLSIVNSILDLSKIEAGELELDVHDFSLESLVNNIQSILLHRAAKKHLQLTCELDPDIWPAYRGDSARLRQILINLLDNAIKFTPRGNVRLHVKVTAEDNERQQLKITVIDTGIGMDEEYLGHIFAKFSQAEKSISRRFGGTGLGMPITKEILKLMGGDITVTSEKGRGSKFVIRVDFPRGDVDMLAAHAPTDTRMLEGRHLLLVEDNVMNRFIASKSLSHFGCTVDEAENGRMALSLLEEKRYDAVLMDIQMPELDGVETTKIIRRELKLDVPIIALTANAFKQDIDRYLAIGMNDYVTKPFDEQLLFNTLSGLLDRSVAMALPDTPKAAVNDEYSLQRLRELSHGDESFVHTMIGVFTAQTPAALQEIRHGMEAGDYLTVAKAAHRIKPSIESMGIHQLEGVAKTIELAGKAEVVDVTELRRLVDYLTTVLDAVVARLQREHPEGTD